VLFDRICRQHGITHLCTGVRCPTTTGKIERFHKMLRSELLAGRRFADLAEAQQVLDTWVAGYNSIRPHQALAMHSPAQRFHHRAATPPATVAPPTPPARPRPWSIDLAEVTRIMGSNGCIRVAYQRVSVGRRLTGEVVVARVEPTVVNVFHRGQLIRSIARDNALEVRQLRAKEVSSKRQRRQQRSAPTTHVS
jgi:hypothetical protein